VRRLPEELLDGGLSVQQVHDLCRARLGDGGIQVVETEGVPTIAVGCLVNRAPDNPGTVGLIFLMGIYQSVHLHRLERDMTLSTTTLVGGRVCPEDKATQFLLDEMNYYVDRFVVMVREATAKMESGGGKSEK
jgi:hypothetical protein